MLAPDMPEVLLAVQTDGPALETRCLGTLLVRLNKSNQHQAILSQGNERLLVPSGYRRLVIHGDHSVEHVHML
jgi:bifunctional N-acetylglucosamine-1-phosphate-uridyltransferase/glucosamine-1-phosphate-acetyltransferase GlmU-like protein